MTPTSSLVTLSAQVQCALGQAVTRVRGGRANRLVRTLQARDALGAWRRLAGQLREEGAPAGCRLASDPAQANACHLDPRRSAIVVPWTGTVLGNAI